MQSLMRVNWKMWEPAHGSSDKDRIISPNQLKEIVDFKERKIRQFDGER
jgi:hypothetical protein